MNAPAIFGWAPHWQGHLAANYEPVVRCGWLVGALIVVAVGCSSGSSPTQVSKEVAATQCGRAADSLSDFKMARQYLNQDGMVQAIDAMREISSAYPGTDISELVDTALAAMTPMIQFQQNTDDFAAIALEFRRSASVLGLWCIDHTSPDVSADLAQRFFRGS